jgi:hypothetical protein
MARCNIVVAALLVAVACSSVITEAHSTCVEKICSPPLASFNVKTCKCECPSQYLCEYRKVWNAKTCSCQCSDESKECGNMRVFNEETCRCPCPHGKRGPPEGCGRHKRWKRKLCTCVPISNDQSSEESLETQDLAKTQDILGFGKCMFVGEKLTAQTGCFIAYLQRDGNFIIKKHDGRVLWTSGTFGTRAGDRVCMQTDGNLVVQKGPNDLMFQSATSYRSGDHLRLQDDGQLAIYTRTGDHHIWLSGVVDSSCVHI